MTLRIGTAGWSIPRQAKERFPGIGSHLERYATRLNAVEINSSFYRPHQHKTYVRWADSSPDDFRFSVKLPKAITHEARLVDANDELLRFVDETAGLGQKLGAILIQLPPSLEYDAAVADDFFARLRQALPTTFLVLEPRHASWFTPTIDSFLQGYRIARVAADPPPALGAAEPAGWPAIAYYRLHGSPRIYYSAYEAPFLSALAEKLTLSQAAGVDAWCIFDNTALGAATENALEMLELLANG